MFVSRERLVERAVLAYGLVFVVVLTLSPMTFVWPDHWNLAWWSDWPDLPANVLFYLPVGFLFVLARTPGRTKVMLAATLFGAALSAALETCQLFLPVRLTALTDVLGNTLGTSLGAWLCTVVRGQLQRVLPDVLTIDHPLLNIIYLCLPLMGLSSIDADADSPRTWLLLPLGLMGTITLCGLWRYRLAGHVDVSWWSVVVAVLLWFLCGASPGMLSTPAIVASCAVVMVLTSLALLARPPHWAGADARFERQVLARLWPCMAVYLLMLVEWPPPAARVPFHAGLWYPAVPFARHMAMHVAEQTAALTLFGYLLAQSLGRSRRAPARVRAACLLTGVVGAILIELGRGFLPNDQASVVRGVLATLGAAFGVFLYGARINVLQILRGSQTSAAGRGRASAPSRAS